MAADRTVVFMASTDGHDVATSVGAGLAVSTPIDADPAANHTVKPLPCRLP